MLKELKVSNYALIKDLEISFDKGLTIITGETGAGKSIIMGALSLVLGSRADTMVLLDKSRKCIVEAIFDIDKNNYARFFEANDLDFEKPALFRREISPNGRSRAFINDTPVTLDIMKDIGQELIDIHSQHQTLLLRSNSFQLNLVDSFAEHNGLLDEYGMLYYDYKEYQKELHELTEKADQSKADLDYYSFQLKQLDEVKLTESEEKELEEEQEVLKHAGDIHEALARSSFVIGEDERSAASQLQEVRRLLERISSFYPAAEQALARVESTILELNDLGNELAKQAGAIEADPSRLEYVQARLDTLFSLMQKHRVDSTALLIGKREEIRDMVAGIESSDERLSELHLKVDSLRNKLNKIASEISENRMRQLPMIEKDMNSLLVQLGMPNARFETLITRLEDFCPTGRDHADLLFSANKQTMPENLGKVASGGELSRVMLSLKSLLTENKKLPTIFFDEVDSGVSGEVATRVGSILSEMGSYMQVINITHLPQVAAKATRHYFVYKEDEDDSTITHIKLLSKKERLNEVARLLSGNEITKASLDNARELIDGV